MRGLGGEVMVIGHQAPRVDCPLEPSAHLAQEIEEGLSIDVVDAYVLLPVTAAGQLIVRPGGLDPQRSCRDRDISANSNMSE